MLEGNHFVLFSGHKPLMFACSQSLDKAPARQLRHLDCLSQFMTEIRHVSGKENIIVDPLSRIDQLNSVSFDYSALSDV